jgi:lysophospholipase L1-like esterase
MIELWYNSGNNYQDVFDTNFHNSVVYSQESGYQIRSAASEWKFQYSGTRLGLKVKPTMYSLFPQWSQIVIIIDGSVHSVESFSDESIKEITLPDGEKTVTLVEGATSMPSGIIGTFLTAVWVEKDKFTKINETPVSEKFVFLGNSITVGANADVPSVEGYAALFRSKQSKEVGILGYGFGELKDFAETPQKRADTIAHIVEMFSNVTTTKKLIISLGTNDYGLSSTPAATFQTWLENLLDDINAQDNTIVIYCISPIIRSDDAQLLDDIRDVTNTVCIARAYATHIPGKPILIVGDLADDVHPTVNGHDIYNDDVAIAII